MRGVLALALFLLLTPTGAAGVPERPPCPVTAATSRSDDVLLEWAPVPDVDGYRVARREAGGEFARVAQLDASATRFVDDAPGNGLVEYEVTAVKGPLASARCGPVAVTLVPFFNGPAAIGLVVVGAVLVVALVLFARRG